MLLSGVKLAYRYVSFIRSFCGSLFPDSDWLLNEHWDVMEGVATCFQTQSVMLNHLSALLMIFFRYFCTCLLSEFPFSMTAEVYSNESTTVS